MNKRLFLLDAYALIYRSYYAFIKNPRTTSKGLNTSAMFGFVNTLEELIRKEKPTHIAVAFDPKGGTFRHEAFEQYKAQRAETPEDIRKAVPIIKDLLKAYNIPILEVAGFEADDVIGTVAKEAKKKGFVVYMMTPDKDYAQLVEEDIYIYKPKYGSNECEVVDSAKVLEKYSLQRPEQMIDLLGLMGDASDNIPGCPGVGEVTAKKLIGEWDSIDNLLNNKAKLKGALQKKVTENEEMIRFSRFLATIRTDVPVEWSEEEFAYTLPNEPEIDRLFDELEFRNLRRRVATAPQAAAPSLQQSLFDVIEPQENATTATANNGEPLQEMEENAIYSSYDKENVTYRLVDEIGFVRLYLEEIRKKGRVVIDTETTDVDPFLAKIVGLSLCFEKGDAIYIPLMNNEKLLGETMQLMQELFAEEDFWVVGQNIKYDMLVLQKYGVEIRSRLFDTMVAHYLIHPELPHNMDSMAEVFLRYKTIHIDELIGAKGKNQRSMGDLPPEEVYIYACEDADITFQLYERFEQELTKRKLNELFYEMEMPLTKVLYTIEKNGVRIDTQALKQLSTELTEKLIEKERQIYEAAGETFNINSPKQVGEILFDKLEIDEKAKKTKTGQYITSEEVLEKLRNKHEVVEKILDYRGLKKLLSTYVDALPELINKETGKIHTSFNQTVTATGRLSSTRPNLQNIPIRDEEGREIRRAFIPEPNSLFLSADYSQIELRIMAHLSGDTNMIDAFNSGADIHTATAAKIYKVPIEAVTKEMRRKAKTANFGIIYGISIFGLSDRLSIPRGEAKELIEGYFETYPGVKAYMDRAIEEAKGKGYVETLYKRRRELRDINSANANVRGYAERNAINAPIQGTSADIIKLAMVKIQQRIDQEGLASLMLIQVHDELNFSVPRSEKDRMQQIVVEEMQNVLSLAVPLIAEVGCGNNWFEAH